MSMIGDCLPSASNAALCNFFFFFLGGGGSFVVETENVRNIFVTATGARPPLVLLFR